MTESDEAQPDDSRPAHSDEAGCRAGGSREAIVERWERAAAGWGKRADQVRAYGMAASAWMIEHADLQPGHRVLELAAGPGDTGFLAAELIRPGGTLISSDHSEAMLRLARQRAQAFGIDNVEFQQLDLEWIDLETASVDAVLCRWGLMLVVDSGAAAREMRRVLRPGGRVALAVWDEPEHNPWAAVPIRALIALGHAEAPPPDAPGMFALAPPGRLSELLQSAGFVDVVVADVELDRSYTDIEAFVAETRDLSVAFADAFERASADERAEIVQTIATLTAPYTGADGTLRFPGKSLVAVANA
jgi:SAM-dependent methyltransferase